jgi:hypothetical protein
VAEKKRKTTYSNQPTSFSDGVNIAGRSDEGILLQFVSETPDSLIENHRTVMARDGAIELLKNLCYVLKYFPTEKEIAEGRSTEKN